MGRFLTIMYALQGFNLPRKSAPVYTRYLLLQPLVFNYHALRQKRFIAKACSVNHSYDKLVFTDFHIGPLSSMLETAHEK